MADDAQGKIRARLRDGVVTVKVLLRHPMETGSTKNPATGAALPRHFIREVVCEQNGTPVLTMDWGWGVAANPYVSFDLSEGEVGDRIALSWVDNTGATGKLETDVQ
jgi:sulfur-oxidizing protein SoxZ